MHLCGSQKCSKCWWSLVTSPSLLDDEKCQLVYAGRDYTVTCTRSSTTNKQQNHTLHCTHSDELRQQVHAHLASASLEEAGRGFTFESEAVRPYFSHSLFLPSENSFLNIFFPEMFSFLTASFHKFADKRMTQLNVCNNSIKNKIDSILFI